MVSGRMGWTVVIVLAAVTVAGRGQIQTGQPQIGQTQTGQTEIGQQPVPSFVIPNQPNFVEAPVAVAPPAVEVDDACLACICQASTGCKPLACHVAGPSQYFCGPYLISWAYWADAGKPSDDPTNPYAFEICLSNKECSERTIRAYMAKNGRDCDGDSRITCNDVARIHKAGPLGCHNQWVDNTEYWKVFVGCGTIG